MFRAIITQKDKTQTWNQCESLDELNKWIEKVKATNAWGFPDRWILDSPMSPLSDEEKAKATETRVVDEVTEYFFPAEYTIEITDITAEIEQEKANAEALKYLADTDWLMIRELEIGKPMPEEIKQKRQEARNKVVK